MAKARYLADWSVLHGYSKDAAELAKATIDALVTRTDEARYNYIDLVVTSVNAAARALLEEWMRQTPEYQSELFRGLVAKGREEGREEGRAQRGAEAVLVVLRARALPVSPEVEARIRACRDEDALEKWLERAVSVSSADELLA